MGQDVKAAMEAHTVFHHVIKAFTTETLASCSQEGPPGGPAVANLPSSAGSCSGDQEPTRSKAAKPACQDCGARELTLRPDQPKTDK